SPTSVSRVALSARLGRIFRSTYNASCLRRNRFSATRWARGCSIDEATRTTSPRTQTIVRTSRRQAGWIIDGGYLACGRIADRAGSTAWGERYLAPKSTEFCSDPLFADHQGGPAQTPDLIAVGFPFCLSLSRSDEQMRPHCSSRSRNRR